MHFNESALKITYMYKFELLDEPDADRFDMPIVKHSKRINFY